MFTTLTAVNIVNNELKNNLFIYRLFDFPTKACLHGVGKKKSRSSSSAFQSATDGAADSTSHCLSDDG